MVMEVQVAPDKLNEMRAFVKAMLPGTRAFDGCQAVTAYQDSVDQTRFVFIEVWDARSNHEAYLSWRAREGADAGDIEAVLTDTPFTIRYLNLLEV